MKLPKALFWVEWVQKMFWDPFWWVVLFLIILWVPFLRVWWWIFLPIMLQKQLKTLYLWWLDWDYDYAKTKWIILEATPPKEILVPAKAMEDFFNIVWTIFDSPNFREKWCDGEIVDSPYWSSFEIVSTEGKVHFYIRIMASHKLSIESALYGHYPDIELKEVSDYTKLVPPTVPNDEWDMYGEDYDYYKPAPYPIKTFEKFFEPQGEKITAEEKRIDPLLSLLEGMSKLGPGENYWVQFILNPIHKKYNEPGFWKEAQKEINKISKRPEKKQITFLEDLTTTLRQIIMGPEKEGSGESAKYSWLDPTKTESNEKELLLTPGEREIVTELENKLKKPQFRTTIRGVYVAKRENWTPSNRILMRSYMAHFATENLNTLGFSTVSRPRIHYFMRKRRVFSRARKMFRMTVLRFPPLFPNRSSAAVNPILSAEEVATLYHFPVRVSGMIGPTMGKIESKKAGPPPNLPIE